MASNKRKIQILENRVIRLQLLTVIVTAVKKYFPLRKIERSWKQMCTENKAQATSKGLSSPRSSSVDRLSMYSSRGCSPSLKNLSASIDESEYHGLINLRNNNKMIEKKNKIERKDPKTRLTFAYSFEDSMSQELTERNEHDGFYDEERNKQEREEETENVEVEDVEEEREEETRNAEEEDEDTERGEETENTEEESGDTGDDESDVYSASEVVSDIDNDVLEEEGDAQDNSVNEWGAITDLTPELEVCT
ncbi:glutamic acid-rich protein-like [Bombyx mandarina]|uniref:Glutamic acid-rich protein-like n=1 Tax=Bombyx mandarina TaxID=7092 RepID=A0A6J2JCN8_BOMMA|nr:glutamic acid-rich protein-like [Bombyx mandarina]